MNIAKIAAATIPPPTGKALTTASNGATGDIINAVLYCFKKYHNEVKNFVPALKADTLLKTCQNIWDFVKQNIKYLEDPEGYQWAKSPAKLWGDKVGDCKSFSVFVASCLAELGIDFVFRFVSYDRSAIPTHVYVVVPYQGSEIVLDDVIDRFNYQLPYTHKIDYPMLKVQVLSGVPKRMGTTYRPSLQTIGYTYRPSLQTIGNTRKGGRLCSVYGAGPTQQQPARVVGSTRINLGQEALTAATAVVDIYTGNWIGAVIAAVSFIVGLFPGHSAWWKADKALSQGDWQAVKNAYLVMYAKPDNGTGKMYFEGGLAGIIDPGLTNNKYPNMHRYDILDLVWQHTQDPQILQLYNQAIRQGLVDVDLSKNIPLEADIQAAVNAKLKAAADAQAAAAKATTATAKATTATAGTPNVAILAAIGALGYFLSKNKA